VQTRRLLLEGVADFQLSQRAPWRGPDIAYNRIRAVAAIVPNDLDWRTLDTVAFSEQRRSAA